LNVSPFFYIYDIRIQYVGFGHGANVANVIFILVSDFIFFV